MGYEKLAYEVLFKEGPYEIRKYESFTKMETSLSNDSGFSKLFRYITGNNSDKKNIAMTVPVITDINTQKMAFTMPKHIEALGIPKPLDESIQIIKEPERYYMSYTFKGQRDMNKTIGILYVFGDRRHLEVIGTPKILTYQGPYIPNIFKVYDIIVEIKHDAYLDQKGS